jgi:predicted nucleic acid-binding protein
MLISCRYLLDTNVLIPYFSRDFFLELGKRGLPIHWSLSIEAEFRIVWARLYPQNQANGARILQLMRAAVPDWRAAETRAVLKEANLPDPKDRHVLAAAVGVGANTIVTSNLKDFPAAITAIYGVVARRPDDVLCDLFDENPAGFAIAAAAMRARMKNPAMSPKEWLDGVRTGGLSGLATRLRPLSEALQISVRNPCDV